MLERAVCFFGLFLLLLFGGLPVLVSAEEPRRVETLENSISEAIEKSYKLKARQERLDQAEFTRKQARADFLPKMGLDYSYTRLSHENI